MRDFVIFTDSCCDLPAKHIEEFNIPYVSLTYSYNEKEMLDDFGITDPLENFYNHMKKGTIPKTSQPSSHSFYESFKNVLSKGSDVLYIGVSSGLSGTISGAHTAKFMLEEEFHEQKVHIIDVLTASLGQGLLVLKAIEMKANGATLSNIIDCIENVKHKLNTYMVVDDINHLKRGGRISAASAIVGNLLNIKPCLAIDKLGKVSVLGKVRGRKKALTSLLDKFKEKIENAEEQIIGISHGHCIEDALILKELILKHIKVKDIIISYVGPVVGCYGGPGALALFFLGTEKE